MIYVDPVSFPHTGECLPVYWLFLICLKTVSGFFSKHFLICNQNIFWLFKFFFFFSKHFLVSFQNIFWFPFKTFFGFFSKQFLVWFQNTLWFVFKTLSGLLSKHFLVFSRNTFWFVIKTVSGLFSKHFLVCYQNNKTLRAQSYQLYALTINSRFLKFLI